MRRETGGGLTLVAVSLVLAALRGEQPAQQEPVDGEPRAQDEQDEAAAEPQPGAIGRSLLRSYLGLDPKADLELPDGTRLTTLIATVPDPLASHLDWAFDSHVDAIRRAYERMGFVAQRLHYPWALGGPRAEDQEVKLAESPGAILFRKVGEDGVRLELVYLVGEIANGGVALAALRAALEERRQLPLAPAAPATPDLRIVGPTFSGSSRSLLTGLRAFAEEEGLRRGGDGPSPTRVSVVSGAATSESNRVILGVKEDDVSVTYRSTLHTDETLLAVLLDLVLERLHLQPDTVAILQESSTEYGQALKGDECLRIPFPMSIGSLRRAYFQDGKKLGARSALPGRAAQASLELDLRDESRKLESMALASRLTPASIDLLLDEMARAIGQREIKIALLFATDVRDKLFLGSELKRRLPDLQLVTTESNVLYLQPDLNRWLRGMIVLSTYPLLLRDRSWNTQSRSQDQLLFSNEGAEGTFNATLLQLGAPSELLADYAHPLEDAGPSRPSVWATVVGAGTMLPLSLYTPEEIAAVRSASDPGFEWAETPAEITLPDATREPRPGPSVFLSLWLLGCEFFLLWLSFRESTEQERWPAKLVVQHERYTLGLFLVALGFLVPALSFFLQLELTALHRAGTWLLLVAAVALFGWRRYQARRAWWDGRRPPAPEEPGEVWAFLCLALAYLVLSIWFGTAAVALEDKDRTSFVLLLHRALEVDQGITPLAPVFLAGIILALWFQWLRKRTRLLADAVPFEDALTGFPRQERLAYERGDMNRRLRQQFPGLRLGLAFTVLAVLALDRFSRPMEALVDVPYSWLFAWILLGGIVGSLLGTVWAGCRIVLIWHSFASLLHRLADLSIALPFHALKETLRVTANLSLWPSWHGTELESLARAKWKALRERAPEGALDAAVVHRKREDRPLVAEALARLVHELDGGLPGDPATLALAREVVALEFLVYVEWVFRSLRQLCMFLLLGSVGNLALISSYPFQPQNEFQWVALLVFGGAMAVVAWLILVMNRNATLSRAADTTPGALTLDRTLLGNVALFVIVPLTAVIGSMDGWFRDVVKLIVPVLIQS